MSVVLSKNVEKVLWPLLLLLFPGDYSQTASEFFQNSANLGHRCYCCRGGLGRKSLFLINASL